MKKKLLSILTFLLLSVMLISLTACGNKENSDDEGSSSVEGVVEDFFDNMGDLKFSKAFDLIDWPAYIMVTEEDYDYDEVEEEYKDFCKEYKDEIKQFESNIDDTADYMSNEYESYDTFKVKVKDIGKAKKVEDTKNIYKVDVEVRFTVEDEEEYADVDDTIESEIYVMKNDGDYYIIDGIDEVLNMF